ncbi:N-methyl-L-tryptophan oxidase [Candidatus Kaiserbacteria bacterium]|nr:N-methyl-L-tryptophan oxidase [Candidatus Kaiserbacteria bacterium]
MKLETHNNIGIKPEPNASTRTSEIVRSGRFATIVLGLGAMGSATTYQLAKKGNKVLGIDQFSPPHDRGSSHGDTRITRLAIGEGEEYVLFALRSHEIWKEIESETGRKLLTQNGMLFISSDKKTIINHVQNVFEKTIAAAKKYGIRHEVLNATQIRERFPQFNVDDDELGYYETDAGFLDPEECVHAQLELAEKHKAEIHTEEKVLSFESSESGVTVTTDKGVYSADKLILAAGPWLPELIGEKHAKPFKVTRQVLYWFDIKDSVAEFLPEKFPVFVWELKGNRHAIYGFPAIDGPDGGVKVATEQYEYSTTPDTVERTVSEEEINAMYDNFVSRYLPGLGKECVKVVSCLYTVTPDSGFVIDTHPEFDNVIIASPCSGHGFKHSAAIGEALSQLVVDGKTDFDLSKFKFNRFTSKQT